LLAEKFGPAYVAVDFHWAQSAGYNQNDAPFTLNVSDYWVNDIDAEASRSRNSSSSADFWTTHCLGAFQGRQNTDRDPNTEGGTQGVSSGKSVIMFCEHRRENNLTDEHAAHSLVHEVGHAFRLRDEYNTTFCNPTSVDKYGEAYPGIMYWVWQGVFVPQNLDCIRCIDYPSKLWDPGPPPGYPNLCPCP
jgi:hypothetical protein